MFYKHAHIYYLFLGDWHLRFLHFLFKSVPFSLGKEERKLTSNNYAGLSLIQWNVASMHAPGIPSGISVYLHHPSLADPSSPKKSLSFSLGRQMNEFPLELNTPLVCLATKRGAEVMRELPAFFGNKILFSLTRSFFSATGFQVSQSFLKLDFLNKIRQSSAN